MDITTLKTKTQFDRVFRNGRKLRGSDLLLVSAVNGLEHSRFGFMVTTKAGNAVKRNLGRRWMREFVRANASRIKPGWDIVLYSGKPNTLESFSGTTTEIEELMHSADLLEVEGVC